MTTQIQSKVGPPHFEGTCKHIRKDNNSIHISLADIIDNTYGKASVLNTPTKCDVNVTYSDDDQLNKITIIDDLHFGFLGLENSSVDNPLNMTHMREGHLNDAETSENGKGLKNSIIFVGDDTDIYTRAIEDDTETYYHVHFDIPEMCGRQNASESYEPTLLEKITDSKYEKCHKYEYGTTITISNIRKQKFVIIDKAKFENELHRPEGKMRQNAVMTCISYNYVSSSLLDVPS